MFEKNLIIEYLLDFYGDVLPPRVRGVMESYYGEDLSLAEIAEGEGISRQGVRHLIKKGEEELLFLEEKLGLAATFTSLTECADKLEAAINQLSPTEDEGTRHLISCAKECVKHMRNQ